MAPDRELARRPPALSWRAGLGADLVVVLLVVATRWAFPVEPLDDAFLLLAVVRNALLGGGPHLLFGGEDAALSTLAWPALVALPALAGIELPRALAAVGLLAEVAAALAVRRLALALAGSPAAALLAAAAFATQPVYLLSTLGGMETALYCAALALGARAVLEQRRGELALAAGLLAWTRVEGIALALALLAIAAWQWSRRRPPRAPTVAAAAVPAATTVAVPIATTVAVPIATTVAVPIAAGAALALAAPFAHLALFGSLLPATVAAKAASGGASFEGATRVALELARAPLGLSAYWLIWPSVHAALALVAVAGLVRGARDPELRRKSLAALAPALLHGALFVAAGRSYAVNFPWYFAPPLVAVAALVALGAAPGIAALERRARRGKALLPALLALAVWLAAAPSLDQGFSRVRASFSAHRERAYAAAALWLCRGGGATSLASNEIGTLAFFAPPGTEIVDLFGLARRPELAGLGWLELLDRERPDAVVARADFRYRRELERERPGRYVWVRAGALDLGLEPALAERLRPATDELARLYQTLDLEREPAGARIAPPRRGGRAAGASGTVLAAGGGSR